MAQKQHPLGKSITKKDLHKLLQDVKENPKTIESIRSPDLISGDYKPQQRKNIAKKTPTRKRG